MFDMALGKKMAACMGHVNDPLGVWGTIMEGSVCMLSRYLFYERYLSRVTELGEVEDLSSLVEGGDDSGRFGPNMQWRRP